MKSRALQDKVTPELKSLAVQVAKLQREHPKEFQSLADKAAEFFLELFHVKEPHLNGDEGDLIEGRAACWPMLQYPYTTSQELYLWTVSLCCLTDALLPHRKKILPDTFPLVLLRNNILCGGDKLGFDSLLLSDGLEQLKAELSGCGEPHKQNTPPDTKKTDTPPAAIEKAYQSCRWAERESGLTTDRELYAYLKQNPLDGYDLPAFQTWQSSVSRGRAFYKTHKNTPRGGRSVRAAKASDDPELLKQVSNQYSKT